MIADADHAWVFWEAGDDRVLRAVLPVEGVELYEKQGDDWHRAGRRMPSFGVVPGGEAIPLARAVTPEPFSAEDPDGGVLMPRPIRLVKGGRARPATASLCPLAELGRWAETATTRQIEALRGVLRGPSALVIGPNLPAWPGSERYWGGRLLVPMGYEVRPSLPESTLVEALGDPIRDLLRLIPGDEGDVSVEAIPLGAFRPLTRAGIRLSLVGAPSR